MPERVVSGMILDKLKDFYKAPVEAELIQNEQVVAKKYARWRITLFLSMFFGYIVFYLCRKNISVALEPMQKALGYSDLQIGLLGSSLYFTYAIGKFVNGVIADNTNAKRILPTALFISALANLLFVLAAVFIPSKSITFFGLPPFSPLLWILAFFWGVNGWFQSMGFPPIAKNLSYWFCNKERGIKWSLWSSSHEIGTFLSVVISGFLIAHFGWKAAFYVPAVFAMVFCIFFFLTLQDKPSSIGLPDIEKFKDENYVQPTQQIDEQAGMSYMQIFKKYILRNPMIWMLAIAYIFVYVVRYGTIDWIVKYLVETKGYSIGEASARLSFLPLVGVLGTIGAGFVSDKFFNSKRAPVNILCLSALICCLYMFHINTNPIMDYVYISCIGVFTCGPQVLIGGLSAVESSSKKVASAATGFCGMFGYIGAVLSGAGTGFILEKYSWNCAVGFWIFSAATALAICSVLCILEFRKSR